MPAGVQGHSTPQAVTDRALPAGNLRSSEESRALLLVGSAVWDLERGKALGDDWKLLSLW